ncbi:hypothetical protein EDC19_0537 [Natranaerovirga hydrolytica]|uniref:Uncharacterized protein n=1 Tax=Natranaerovirga hydrolytica TaxID=680378 RepID=A0A4R1N568_9FIRM|nr:hypothetical protein [Natranaerovirga hydrolytica]TCK98119.1 hypothetical protein EDC19_0537 [Natranaerovirga hydrolytica]
MKRRNFTLLILSLGVITILFLSLIINKGDREDFESENEALREQVNALEAQIEALGNGNIDDETVEELNTIIDQLQNEKNTLQEENEQLTSQIESLTTGTNTQNDPFMDDFVRTKIEDLGFDDPEDILKDLVENNQDLIPYEGVLGGTMRWFQDHCYILTEKYVLGYFEDGHISGQALLRYSVDNNQDITWVILDAYLDGEE